METNAGKDLLEIIDRWDASTSGNAITARGSVERGRVSPTARVEIDRAVSLLTEVEAFSHEIGDRDGGDEAFFAAVWTYIYLPRVDWASDKSATILDYRDRSTLKMYARLMSGHRSTPRLDDADVVALRGAIEQCLDLLGVAPAGVEEHREHITYLLKRCLDILDGESVDLIALQKLAFQTVGAAMSDETLWTWDESGSFFQNVSVIARVWGPKVAAQAAVQVSADLVIDGGKVAAQLGHTVIKGLIEAGSEE